MDADVAGGDLKVSDGLPLQPRYLPTIRTFLFFVSVSDHGPTDLV